jgi:hypothetical protein
VAYESDPIAQKLNGLVSSQGLFMGLICFDELNSAEQALIGTWELVNEVYNGGFMQYFRNSSWEHAAPMIAVFRSFGAHRVAAILESAIALAGSVLPWAIQPKFVTTVGVKNSLAELDRELYGELDDLYLHVFRYPSKHRDQIDAPADFWTEATSQ